MSYLVGARLLLTVTVRDKATSIAADPSAFVFVIKPPASSSYVSSTYAWNGTAWTNSEAVIAVPAKGATGIFTLEITIPYENVAQGAWHIGWHSTENDEGKGEGSGELAFTATASKALP